MVLVGLFGVIDILMGISLILLNWEVRFIPVFLLIAFGLKTLIFLKSIASLIDILAAIMFILALTGITYNFITWIAAVWLLQKGILSLLAH